MLQNQRQTNNLYRIDSNQNLYRIILEVFTQKNNRCFLDTFSCEAIDFVEKMNLPCQIFLWKVLDFVEGNLLVCRAEIDLVKNNLVPDLGALYWIEGSSTSRLIARGIFFWGGMKAHKRSSIQGLVKCPSVKICGLPQPGQQPSFGHLEQHVLGGHLHWNHLRGDWHNSVKHSLGVPEKKQI